MQAISPLKLYIYNLGYLQVHGHSFSTQQRTVSFFVCSLIHYKPFWEICIKPATLLRRTGQTTAQGTLCTTLCEQCVDSLTSKRVYEQVLWDGSNGLTRTYTHLTFSHAYYSSIWSNLEQNQRTTHRRSAQIPLKIISQVNVWILQFDSPSTWQSQEHVLSFQK